MIEVELIIITIVCAIVGVGLIGVGIVYLRQKWIVTSQQRERKLFKESHASHARGNLVQCLSTPVADDYDIFMNQELGKGACGVVVVADSTTSTEQYAVKIVDKSAMDKGRIDREIQLLRDVDHPNIVRLFRVYDSPKRMYFVMELCAGGHLGNLLQRQSNRHLDEEWARTLTKQLVSAVAHLHSRGIAHRDIKLQNILMDSSNDRNAQVKLIDFGYSARFIGNLPMRTKCGTPYSTAPEVYREFYDERCDIWSLGVVLYIMFCGKKPFENVQIEGELEKAGKAAMLTNILAGRYSLADPAFALLSKEAMNFMTSLLNKNYKRRPRASAVLSHPWLKSPQIPVNGKSKVGPSSNATSAVMKSQKSLFAVQNVIKMSARTDFHRVGAIAMAFGFQPRQATDMRALFQSFDTDLSGALSPVEFEKAMRTILPELSAHDCQSIFHKIDVNRDGQVTYTEFLAATIDPAQIDIEHLNKAFQLLDADHNGYITADELRKVLVDKATSLAQGPANGTLANWMTGRPYDNNVSTSDVVPPGQQMKLLLQAVTPRSSAKISPADISCGQTAGVSNLSSNTQPPQKGSDVKRGGFGNIEDRVECIVKAFDVDKDGLISYDEFLWAMTGAGPAPKHDPNHPVHPAWHAPPTITAVPSESRSDEAAEGSVVPLKGHSDRRQSDAIAMKIDSRLEIENIDDIPIFVAKTTHHLSQPGQSSSVKVSATSSGSGRMVYVGKGNPNYTAVNSTSNANATVDTSNCQVRENLSGKDRTTKLGVSPTKGEKVTVARMSLAALSLVELDEESEPTLAPGITEPMESYSPSQLNVPTLNSRKLFGNGKFDDGFTVGDTVALGIADERRFTPSTSGWTAIELGYGRGADVHDFDSKSELSTDPVFANLRKTTGVVSNEFGPSHQSTAGDVDIRPKQAAPGQGRLHGPASSSGNNKGMMSILSRSFNINSSPSNMVLETGDNLV